PAPLTAVSAMICSGAQASNVTGGPDSSCPPAAPQPARQLMTTAHDSKTATRGTARGTTGCTNASQTRPWASAKFFWENLLRIFRIDGRNSSTVGKLRRGASCCAPANAHITDRDQRLREQGPQRAGTGKGWRHEAGFTDSGGA